MGKKQLDYSKLRGRITEKLGSVIKLSKETGITKVWLYDVLKNGKEFSQRHIVKIVEVLEIEENEIYPYFFTYRD